MKLPYKLIAVATMLLPVGAAYAQAAPNPVPEPSIFALLGLGALSLIAIRKRK